VAQAAVLRSSLPAHREAFVALDEFGLEQPAAVAVAPEHSPIARDTPSVAT
jgi:hypothetical protein